MLEELKEIRQDLMYANNNNDRILLGFAINRLDTFMYNNQEKLK